MVKGIYVHIPFCSYKCPYCDFTSLTNSPVSGEEYVNLLKREIGFYKGMDYGLETLYFGGGTPTLLEPKLLGEIIEEVQKFGSPEEITVEANPETVSGNKLKELKKLGVNRLSIGVQSFLSKGLEALGRKHSVEDSIRAYESAREVGFETVSIDLIYAYPGQKAEDVEEELRWIDRLRPDHLSAYMLTPYEGTPLGFRAKSGEVKLPEEEELASIYDLLWRGLKELGYERYELSNWAQRGKECRHNLLYWTMEEFVGLGVSAWGFVGRVRYGNTKNVLSYAEGVLSNKRPLESEVFISDRDFFEESLMLRLRLRWGLGAEEKELIPPHLVEFFEEREGRLGIREEFMLLANEITAEVLVYNSDRKPLEVRNG